MKQVVFAFGLIFSILSGYANGDRLYNFYVQHDQATYYLSAPYGGGDELVTKKLTNAAGINESFTLEYVSHPIRRAPGSPPVPRKCRIKTYRNYYLSLTESGELIAEEKDPGTQNLFDVTTQFVRTQTYNRGGNPVTKKIYSIKLEQRLPNGGKRYLSFDPSEETLRMGKSKSTAAILAQTLDVTVKNQLMVTGYYTSYELRWMKSMRGDRRPLATSYIKVSYGKYSPRSPDPPITHIWKTNESFEKVKYVEHLKTITLRTRDQADKAVKLESLILYKQGKYYKTWKLDTRLEPGKRIVLFMDGRFRVY